MSWADVEMARRVRAPRGVNRTGLFCGLMGLGMAMSVYGWKGEGYQASAGLIWLLSSALVALSF